jgi:hypothetical protein
MAQSKDLELEVEGASGESNAGAIRRASREVGIERRTFGKKCRL